jgi:hypothetical protein
MRRSSSSRCSEAGATTEVKQQAREAMVAERTLKRAKAVLMVTVTMRGFREGWGWELPPHGATAPTVTPVGPLRPSSCQVAPLQEGHPSKGGHEEGHASNHVAPFANTPSPQQLTHTTTTSYTKGAKGQ